MFEKEEALILGDENGSAHLVSLMGHGKASLVLSVRLGHERVASIRPTTLLDASWSHPESMTLQESPSCPTLVQERSSTRIVLHRWSV